ncbi:hypothetical protein QDR25_09150 [Acinetobacter baumannii]|uniref:hypothetical protein n=1 Tax=Acinetobacter baumannii TaxID=470 RepID=UPI0024497C27|nr:hypothetical protein [Acinetobacter baumannii]MDH2481220.1 hypothetical protein [Acinetobacter baumannii]MDH2502050.1 hypothetical protein [Acinetobacter baumannii]
MLLIRSRPNDQQTFSDYLNDLGKKNGFTNIQTFKKFLINSSKKRYYIYSINSITIFRIISGLYIELGIDQVEELDIMRTQCFRCLDRYPEIWSWSQIAEYPCVGPTFTSKKYEPLQQLFKTKNKEEYCGLIQCSMSKLGLNTSPLSDRIYFADLIPEGTLSSKKYGLIKKYL